MRKATLVLLVVLIVAAVVAVAGWLGGPVVAGGVSLTVPTQSARGCPS